MSETFRDAADEFSHDRAWMAEAPERAQRHNPEICVTEELPTEADATRTVG